MITAPKQLSQFERVLWLDNHMVEVQAEIEVRKIRKGTTTDPHGTIRKRVMMDMASVNHCTLDSAIYIKRNGTYEDWEKAKECESLFSLYQEIRKRSLLPAEPPKQIEPPKPAVRVRFDHSNADIVRFNDDKGNEYGLADFRHELVLKNEEILNGFKRTLRVHSDLDKEKSKSVVLQHIDLLIHQLTELKGDL